MRKKLPYFFLPFRFCSFGTKQEKTFFDLNVFLKEYDTVKKFERVRGRKSLSKRLKKKIPLFYLVVVFLWLSKINLRINFNSGNGALQAKTHRN
jgi:hypothetical protein